MVTPSPNQNFSYPKLDLSTKQIRLLKLLPGSRDNRLAFSLECHDVKSVSFVALSYTWDQYQLTDDTTSEFLRPNKTAQSELVLVQNQTFRVTPSLAEFIGTIASTKVKDRLFFADQICINQFDDEEKAHQVALMGDVYSEALEVVAWVVPLEGFEDDALRRLAFDGELRMFLNNRKSVSWIKRIAYERVVQRDVKILMDHLFSAYWSRQWIVQEIVLARELSFQIGNHNFNWEVVLDASQYIKEIKRMLSMISADDGTFGPLDYSLTPTDDTAQAQKFYILVRCMQVLQYKRQSRHRSGQHPKGNIFHVLNRTGYRDCSKQRDKIFGLLGLVNTEIKVDYLISLVRLYLALLLEGLSGIDEIDPNFKRMEQRASQVIWMSAVACSLDIRGATVMLVTERTLSRCNIGREDLDVAINSVWYFTERSDNEDQAMAGGLLEIIATRLTELQAEIRRCKESGEQMTLRNWDDSDGLSDDKRELTESHTYNEWLKIVDDLVPNTSIQEWRYD